MSASSVVRTSAAVAGEVVRLVLVEPVRAGRLRGSGWAPGLRAIVALALTALVGAGVLVLSAPTIRRHSDLTVALGGDLVYPRWTTPVFLGLTVLTLALLHAASLHLTAWLRLGTLVMVALAVTGVVIDSVGSSTAASVVTFVGAGLLAALTALRWRGDFRWWEFVVSLVLIGATMGVAIRLGAERSQPFGFDFAPVALTLTMQLVASLAIPFTFVAGLAFAQLAVLLTHRVGGVVEERVGSSRWLAVLVAVVAAADLALVGHHLRRPTDSGASHLEEWVAAGVLLAVALGVAVLVVLRASRPAGRLLDRLEDAVSGLALPVALAVTVVALVVLVVSRVGSQLVRIFDDPDLAFDDAVETLTGTGPTTWTRVAVGAALVAWAVWQQRRQPLPAVLAATIGVTLLVTMVGNVTEQRVELPWTSEALTDVAAVATIAVLVALVAARRLDRRRLVALGIALGLSLAFSVRSTFDAPFVAVFGLGATGALFLGVLWATLTDADDANADSPRYPRPARVLFFLANSLLAMTSLAFVSVADAKDLGVDIGDFAVLGDDYLGTGLLLAAYSVLAWELLSSRGPGRPT